MYSGAKKGVFFSENPLTRRIPSECLASFPAKNSEKLLTDKFLRIQSRSKLKTQNSKLKTQNSKLKTQNSECFIEEILSNTVHSCGAWRLAANPLAGFFRWSFFVSIGFRSYPDSVLGGNKIRKRSFL